MGLELGFEVRVRVRVRRVTERGRQGLAKGK